MKIATTLAVLVLVYLSYLAMDKGYTMWSIWIMLFCVLAMLGVIAEKK